MSPLYAFRCPAHGLFEQFLPMASANRVILCPHCSGEASRVYTPFSIAIHSKPRLRYGSESPGKILTHQETGGLDIYIPSEGALEQEEVDDIALAAVEKEQARVKKAKKEGPQRRTQERLAEYTALALKTKPGKRAKVLREAIAESGDKVRNNLGQLV